MRSSTVPLPPSLAAPQISARAWLALAAGVGCAVCAYAGLYPRFDDGKLRVILALTSAPFGAAVVAAALGARSAARAFGVTLLLAGLLGIASVMLPAAILSSRHGGNDFAAGCIIGAIVGAPTGVVYGIPLAILAALGHRQVRAQSHEATDRGARVSGSWLFFVALLGLLGTQALDQPTMDYDVTPYASIPPSPLPSIVACVAALGGVLLIAHATGRLRSREAWLGRVRVGLEPAFRLRPVDARDRVEGLPRISEGATVVEWCPDDRGEATAYRTAAAGVAIALVDDRSVIA